MHPFATGSSVVSLSRPHSDPESPSVQNDGNMAFTDGTDHVIATVTSAEGCEAVTVVTTDALGNHFLSTDQVLTKIELDSDGNISVPEHMELMIKKDKDATVGSMLDSDKKVCLWPTGSNTTCGKTFTKLDSLKRHLAETHKGVRPFACNLCDKTYGRRDYLQRHLKSHNASYAVNLAASSTASATMTMSTTQSVSQMDNKIAIGKNDVTAPILFQVQGPGGTLHVVQQSHPATIQQPPSNTSASLPFINLNINSTLPTAKLGSKICRWVQSDGTVCGKTFSKLDSLRRHVNELHKGVRPFICHLCEKSYGRRDYLDRHLKVHNPDGQKKRLPSVSGVEWGSSSMLVVDQEDEDEDSSMPKLAKKKRKEIPPEEKKVCLWVQEDGMACGKTFTKFDSLKRHVSEAHKGIRPYGCSLCDKNYGRRDYLLRHLKSHNDVDLSNITASSLVTSSASTRLMPSSDSMMVDNSRLGGPGLAVASQPHVTSAITGSGLPIKLGKKRNDDKKTCRWVLDNGTVCGKSFSKFDSLRRHVQELHKGIRPYVCQICDKSYGRRDYLDRHMKSHLTDAQGGANCDSVPQVSVKSMPNEDDEHDEVDNKCSPALPDVSVASVDL